MVVHFVGAFGSQTLLQAIPHAVFFTPAAGRASGTETGALGAAPVKQNVRACVRAMQENFLHTGVHIHSSS
jgi:hypothetical protein